MSESNFLVTGRGVRNYILEKIGDDRLTKTMSRTRSGSNQLFREDVSENGKRKMNFANDGDDDVITLRHSEKHIYAEIVNDEWYWVNGCCECNNEERNWVNSYIECDVHDVCSVCSIETNNPKVTTRWGNRTGWICNICHDKAELENKLHWQAKIEEDYCEYDYENKDVVSCPWCTCEFDAYDSYSQCFEEGDHEIDCHNCENRFNVKTEIVASFSMERL